MVIRTYIDKNNTIIKDTFINTGRNPIAELWYGGKDTRTDYTRHLLYFEIEDLQDRYNKGEFGDLSNVTHTLKMCNSSTFDINLQAQKLLDGKQRTSSFDLCLFKISGQTWDEGTGYDYTQEKFMIGSDNNKTFIESASNWYYATTLNPWVGTTGCTFNGLTGSTCDGVTGHTLQNNGGIYTGSPECIASQHFDKGNENIKMDITTEVNSLITGGTDNDGYGISFIRPLELLIKTPAQYVGFFTRHTQTYYQPFLETIHEDPIIDDRKNFYRGKTNRLYLYSNIGGEPTNLDNNPSISIFDQDGNLFMAFTTGNTVHVTTGIYYVEVFVPITQEDCVLFTDVWGDININSISRPDVELEFEIKDDTEYYNIGDNESLPIEYAMSLSGVKRDEKIKRGDKRKIMVSARIPYTINESEVIDGLDYRLWVREGNTQVSVIDWQPINRAFLKNYFILDTSWMIPNEYYIDIKLTSNMQVITYTEQMKFYVVNQVDQLH
tara:strand:+ start:59 stop:1540 length:1482 start_codon:yes stop_codon:yes gene_type:complete